MNERHDIKWDVNEFWKILVLYNVPVIVWGKDNVHFDKAIFLRVVATNTDIWQ